MLHAEPAALPFPSGFFFDDVDDQVLDSEEDFFADDQMNGWADDIATMLTRELAAARAG